MKSIHGKGKNFATLNDISKPKRDRHISNMMDRDKFDRLTVNKIRLTVNKIFNFRNWRFIGIYPCLSAGFIALLTGCNFIPRDPISVSLNSRFNDEQPSLSGDGRWLAFVSNRNGDRQILVYDLREKVLVDLPGLNQGNTLSESPSLSRTGRYLVYLSGIQGRPDVALYDRLTKQTELITQNYRSWVRNPQISPDGRYIVFETARRGQWDLEVLDRGPQVELDIPNGSPVVGPSPIQ